jgi:8-oxo-dGTP pyrophosphatase MutT (NUDIX family)
MPHIHTEPGQHDFTASALIVKPGKEPVVFMVRHKKYHRYIQPGGHVELHEDPWQAILHEIEEETGYMPSQLRLLQPRDGLSSVSSETTMLPMPISTNVHVAAPDHYHIDSIYLFETDEDPQKPIGENESEDVIWVSQQQLNQMPADELFPDTRDIFNHAFDNYIHTWKPVPMKNFTRS